jgi:hypothetical protein
VLSWDLKLFNTVLNSIWMDAMGIKESNKTGIFTFGLLVSKTLKEQQRRETFYTGFAALKTLM